MQSDYMSASPEEMRTKAQEIETYGDNFDTLIKDLKSAIDFLCDGSWAGSSSQAFLEQYEELKPGFQNTQELILGIAGQLRDIAGILEQTQANIADAIRK